MTKTNLLLTGGTGFLGLYLVKRFLKDDQFNLILPVRSRGNHSAEQRIKSLLRQRMSREEYNGIHDRLKVVEANITRPDFGLTDKQTEALSRDVNVVIHCAALAEFNTPYEKIKRINVDGTQNVLDFALRCSQNGSLESVAHISTIAVSGSYRDLFYEDFLDVGQRFRNTYERTKFEAEKLIRSYRAKGLNINIYRPSIIIGDSRDGYAVNFRVIYQPLQILSLGLYKQIPATSWARYNIVPVDYVSDAIYLIHTCGRSCNRTFHITHSEEVTGDFIFSTASEFFGYRDPEKIPLREFDMNSLRGARRRLLEPYIPYFNHEGVGYDNSEAMSVLNSNGFQWPSVDKKLLRTSFQYCLDRAFITPLNQMLV